MLKKRTRCSPEGFQLSCLGAEIGVRWVVEFRNDLGIREVIKNEQDTMEMNLEMFYGWLMMGDRCPDAEGIRPSLDILYHYAGFFLNTTGGRAYLFRRTPELRLLVSYYCLSILHEADKKGKNNYGLDIYPFISPLLKEISLYTDFQFQSDYINNLNKMVNYYLENR